MEQNTRIKQGLGGTSLVGEEEVATVQVSEWPVTAPPNARVKILSMPASVWNPQTSTLDENYLFHSFSGVWPALNKDLSV